MVDAKRPNPLKIGPLRIDPPLLQAPMAGFTDHAFRRVLREFGGVGLIPVEMISAEGFVRMTGGLKGAPARLWGVLDEPRPLAVQMWDNDEEALAETGRALCDDYGVSVVDLNFGCPVHRVRNAHSGSYLLDDPPRVGRIVERVVRACGETPVTAKIRLGCTHTRITACEVARAVEEAGGAALTVHGRVAKDFFKGQADWDRIAEVKSRVKKMPVIGNGDVDSVGAALEAFKRGVDAVMIGRAGLARPWLFREIEAALDGRAAPPPPSLEDQRALLLRHHGWVTERYGEARGNVLMRRFACNYGLGHAGARTFRTHIGRVKTNAEFHELVARYFPG